MQGLNGLISIIGFVLLRDDGKTLLAEVAIQAMLGLVQNAH